MLQPSSHLDLSTVEFLSGSPTASGLPGVWMLRRLRTTMWLATLLLAVQTLSALPSGRTSPDSVVTNSGSWIPTIAAQQSQMSGSANMLKSTSPHARAVLPVGWRRTADGWQHVSDWNAATRRIPLSQRVVAQRNAQPVWLRSGMTAIRQIPPGSFALAQLAGVGLLFWLVNRKKISSMDQTCHSASQ